MKNDTEEYNIIIKTLNDTFDHIDLIDKLPVCGICLQWQNNHIENKINTIDTLLFKLNQLQFILTSSIVQNQKNKLDVISDCNEAYEKYVKRLNTLKSKYEIDEV